MELRRQVSPSNGRFTMSERKTDSSRNKGIIDSHASAAHETLVSGLMSGMTSPSRPWFLLHLPAAMGGASLAARRYLDEATEILHVVLSGTNTYRALEQSYHDGSLYGTYAGLMLPDFEDVVRFSSPAMGTYRLQVDGRGEMHVMHRTLRMTVADIVSQFGKDKCPPNIQRDFDSNRLYERHEVHHAIERRTQRDPMSPLSINKPIASFYWIEGQKTLLEVSGYDRNPILSLRWRQEDGESWSVTSPAMKVLGATYQLQGQHREKAYGIQASVRPPLVSGAVKINNVPGGVTVMKQSDLAKGGPRPIHSVNFDINGSLSDIADTRAMLDAAFYVPLFRATLGSDRRQVTATEIAERHEEKLLALGPVLESLDHGLLKPMIENLFYYCARAGILPEPPDELQGAPISVRYISTLAQAQRAVGVAALERVIGFAGTLEQLKPGVMDNIDGDVVLHEFAELVGFTPDALVEPEDVETIRAQRAEAAQEEQAIANIPQFASAASLVSDIAARGTEGAQRGEPL
jgi:hypothetical protein